jgi:uncharacterized membrane protein YgdD (TMEM256/DUF423 family)
MLSATKWGGIASILMSLAVAFGAFGAHGLKNRLDTYALSVYEKAVFYHFVHAIGILLVVCLFSSQMISSSALSRINICLLLGIILFAGSLYILAVSGLKWLGAITPIGGLLFIVAWALLAIELLRAK